MFLRSSGSEFQVVSPTAANAHLSFVIILVVMRGYFSLRRSAERRFRRQGTLYTGWQRNHRLPGAMLYEY